MKYGYLFTGLILILLAGCDDITTQESSKPISINFLEVIPSYIEFPENLSVKDTTISVSVNLELKEESATDILYALVRNREVLFEHIIEPSAPGVYQAEFELNLNTARSEQYTVHVYPSGAINSDIAEATVRIISRLGTRPEIIEAFNTEIVQIPQSDIQERVDFYAKVEHPVGQDLISRVEFRLIDQAGNNIGPFEMFDDGIFDESSGLIDEVAGDSLYSRAFFAGSNNNPDIYDVLYYAIGTNGVSSDTVQTTLQFVE